MSCPLPFRFSSLVLPPRLPPCVLFCKCRASSTSPAWPTRHVPSCATTSLPRNHERAAHLGHVCSPDVWSSGPLQSQRCVSRAAHDSTPESGSPIHRGSLVWTRAPTDSRSTRRHAEEARHSKALYQTPNIALSETQAPVDDCTRTPRRQRGLATAWQ